MKPTILLLLFAGSFLSCHSQTSHMAISKMAIAANQFLTALSSSQKEKAQYSFDNEERYDWHFIPKSRKGISLNDLDDNQRKAAMDLVRTGLSDTAFTKATSVMSLEVVLKEIENRPPEDHYRDPGNYYITLFGNPASDSIWGWRVEGHHVSFNFCSENNRIVSGTPSFIGSNPAIVLSGPEKGKEILKDETDLGLALFHALDEQQKQKATINTKAPGDIITSASRKAMIDDPKGILYNELTAPQQKLYMQLLSLYIHRYTRLFAMDMMREIETAGPGNLRFAWAGVDQKGPGNPHYYRLQGPTIIIEYDNTQNNANHVHTVVRDLKTDFGGDELLEHYKNSHR
jgi:hypothetical protein